MPVAEMMSVAEYLQTNYHPDRELVDGELLERNLGEQSHGLLQLNIGSWLRERRHKLKFRVLTEVRLQVRPDRFRIPDVMVIPNSAAGEEIVVTPALLCVEILSRGDALSQMWEKVNDYFAMGVPVCWIIDPRTGHAICAKPDGWTDVNDGILRAEGLEMPLAEVLE
jgi:Uma2 family endonuclease